MLSIACVIRLSMPSISIGYGNHRLIDSVCRSGRVIQLCLVDLQQTTDQEAISEISDCLIRAKAHVGYDVGIDTVEHFIREIEGGGEDGSSQGS